MTATTATASFIEFLVGQGVLKFGDFTLNSGRKSPYFFNLGSVDDGPGLLTLGRAYADAIVASKVEFDVLFGPAYKGIPIAVATGLALAERGINVGVAYNRKEPKDHGRGRQIEGPDLSGKRVIIVEDTSTTGGSPLTAARVAEAAGATVVAVCVVVDRDTGADRIIEDAGYPYRAALHLADLGL